jgi:predicted nucleotidyltransferase
MGLLKFLKENEKSRKIFGKRELKIIEKQLQGISLTQSEKNRLSRDIREKLRFIKEISRFEDEFDLKKASIIKEMIKEVKEIILESKYHNKIKKIILFGSAVENQMSFRSDIDIAVEFFKIEKKDAGKFRIHILGRINDKIDVQVYNVLPKKIKKEINKKGKILYERKNK